MMDQPMFSAEDRVMLRAFYALGGVDSLTINLRGLPKDWTATMRGVLWRLSDGKEISLLRAGEDPLMAMRSLYDRVTTIDDAECLIVNFSDFDAGPRFVRWDRGSRTWVDVDVYPFYRARRLGTPVDSDSTLYDSNLARLRARMLYRESSEEVFHISVKRSETCSFVDLSS